MTSSPMRAHQNSDGMFIRESAKSGDTGGSCYVRERKVRTTLSYDDLARRGPAIMPYDADRLINPKWRAAGGRTLHAADAWLVNSDHDRTASRTAPAWMAALESRIATLKVIAIDEGLPFSEASAAAACAFARAHGRTRQPSTFLIANGNLRLLWADPFGEQIGLQFRDGRDVQYVLFERRGDNLGSVMGHYGPADILRLIGLLGLAHLLD